MDANVSVNYLWHLAQSLSPDNKRWLADRLYKAAEEEGETLYTMEEIHAMVDDSDAEIAAGQTLSAEEAHRRMKEFIATL